MAIPWNKGKTKKEYPQFGNSGRKKGSIPWNKGSKNICKPNSGTFKKGQKAWNLGKKHSEMTRIKMSEKRKLRIGDRSPRWKGGINTYERKLYLNGRRRVLKKGNGGFHTQGEWENLKAQYNWTCPCCHKSEIEIILTEDHIIPLSKGGSDNIENIQPLCRHCNSVKLTKIILF